MLISWSLVERAHHCFVQEHLHMALGNEWRPAQIEQSLRSVGASRVRISRPSSAVSQRSGGSDPSRKPAAGAAPAAPVPNATSGSESGKEDLSNFEPPGKVRFILFVFSKNFEPLETSVVTLLLRCKWRSSLWSKLQLKNLVRQSSPKLEKLATFILTPWLRTFASAATRIQTLAVIAEQYTD